MFSLDQARLLNLFRSSGLAKWQKKLIAIAELQLEPNQNHLLKNLEGSIFTWLFGWLFGCRHSGDSSNVTVAFEDAQVIQT